MFVGVVALNERNGRGLSLFHDGRSDLDPAIMSEGELRTKENQIQEDRESQFRKSFHALSPA